MAIGDISGLIAYWHTRDATGLTEDELRTTEGAGNIADGARVCYWFDKSNHANALSHRATQTVAGRKPYYHTGGSIAGKPFVRFSADTAATNGSGGSLVVSPGLLAELANNGGTGLGSYTVLFLVYQATWTGTSLGPLAYNRPASDQKFNFAKNPVGTGNFVRYNGGTGSTIGQNVALGIGYTFACNGTANTGTETHYVNDAATASFTRTAGTPSMGANTTWYIGADTNSDTSKCLPNGQFYEIVVFSRALAASEIAQVYADWNTYYGTSFGTSVGPLAAGTASTSSVGQTSQVLTATAPVGGTAPYSYQWYRSTTSGSLGSAISGATTLTYTDTGLTAQTRYYYTLRITDSASASVDTAQITAPTHGTSTTKFGFLGDSIMVTTPAGVNAATQYGNELFLTYQGADPVIYNYAASGRTARYYAQTNSGGNNLNTAQMVTDGVQFCHVMVGTNDAAQQSAGTAGYTTTDYVEDLTDICTRIAAAGITVILHQIPWRSDTGSNAVVQLYNAQLDSICNGTTIVAGDRTVYAAWTNSNSGATALNDGLHPTALGVVDLAERWLAGSPQSVLPPAVSFTLTGPSGGATGVASSAFTLTPDSVYTGTITPSSNGGGGTFTPSSRAWTAETGSKTFTYTPATGGTKTISATASPSLIAPSSLSYVTPDVTPPTADSGQVLTSGTSIQVDLSEPCVLLDASKLAVSGKTLSSVVIVGSTLTATISPTAYAGDADLTLVITAGAFEDVAGGDVAGASLTLTNNSTAFAVSGVSISPSSSSLSAGGSQQFTATVAGSGSPSQTVTWEVVETGGGTITAGGYYTAPGSAGTYTVRATSSADPTKTADAAVTVTGGGTSGGETLIQEGPYGLRIAGAAGATTVTAWVGDQKTYVLSLHNGAGEYMSIAGLTMTVTVTNASGDEFADAEVASTLWDGGIISWEQSTAWVVPGVYQLTVKADGGAGNTNIFGPLHIAVRAR